MSAIQTVAKLDPENPWPGMDAFLERDQEFFKGRTSAIEELLRLVLRSHCVVLYGASGLGKTSLLNAGLFPRLRMENVFPVYVRLNFSLEDLEPSQQIKNAVTRQAAAWGIQAPPLSGETLWECFHRKETLFWNNRFRLVTPLLVLDQFEEIFTHGRSPQNIARAKAFVTELADLLESRVPARVKARFDQNPDESLEFDFDVVVCRILLSLREDFLADLGEFRKHMPSIGQVALRLQTMNEEQARQVIVQAGGHLVDDNVADRILEVMTSEIAAGETPASPSGFLIPETSFEPVLLSLFCHELNKQRRDKGLPKITLELVAGSRDQIIADFYKRNISDRSLEVRKFVENELVTQSGFRGTVDEEKALEVMTADDIRELVNRRLLRREPLGLSGRHRLELVHDVLAKTISESRDIRVREEQEAARQMAEEEARQARGAAEEAAELARQAQASAKLANRLAERNRRWLLALVLLLVMTAVLSLMLVRESSNTDRLLSENSRRTALEHVLSHEGDPQALAYLAQALRRDDNNLAARSMTIDLLLRHAWPIPVFALQQTQPAEWVLWNPAGSSFLLPEGKDLRWFALDGRESEKLSHAADVQQAYFNNNGGRLLSLAVGGTAYLWNLNPVRKITLPEKSPVSALAFSPDGTMIAAGTVDGALRVWVAEDLSNILEDRMFHTDQINTVSFSADARYVLTGSRDGLARLFDLKTKRPVGQPLKHGGVVSSAKFSDDGSRFFTLTTGFVTVWQSRSLNRPYRMTSEGIVISARWYGADNDRLLLSFKDATVLWNLNDNSVYDFAPAGSIRQSLSGQKFLTVQKEGLHGLVEVRDEEWVGKPLSSLPKASIHLDSVVSAAEFDTAADYVVTVSAKGLVKVWDLRRAVAAPELLTEEDSVRVFTDADIDYRNRRLLRVSSNSVELVNLRDKNDVKTLDHRRAVLARFSPDASIIATSNLAGSGEVRLWDAATGQATGTPIPGFFDEFSPDGNHIAIVRDRTVAIWDVRQNRPTVEFTIDESGPEFAGGCNPGYMAVGFSPDGTRLLSLANSFVRVWSTTTGLMMASLKDDRGFRSAQFSPDGRQVMIAGCKGYELVNAGDLKTVRDFADFETAGFTRFTPDGRRVLTASTEGNVRLWDLESGKLVADLLHAVEPRSINFSDDGARIAIVTDGAIRIFNSTLGERLSLFPMEHVGVDLAVFIPGSEALLSLATSRGEVLFWKVPVGNSRDSNDLAELAEVVSGQTVDDQGAVTSDNQHYSRVRAFRERLTGGNSADSANFLSRMTNFRRKSTLAQELGRSLLSDPGPKDTRRSQAESRTR